MTDIGSHVQETPVFEVETELIKTLQPLRSSLKPPTPRNHFREIRELNDSLPLSEIGRISFTSSKEEKQFNVKDLAKIV